MVPICHWGVGFSSLLNHAIIQKSQSHSCLLLLPSLPPTACFFTLFPSIISVWPCGACDVILPWAVGV